MKAFAFLLALSLAGYVSTQSHFAWQAGKEYEYQVRGRLMTGITDINTQYAGLEVDYKVILTVVGPQTIVLKPQGFKAIEVNSELEGGWRDGELKNEAPVDIKGELRSYLESPIELTMRQGVVESIKVESRLPTWAVNIKKAQASHFVLDTTGVNVVLNGNMNRKTNSVRPEEANQESGFFYETMEDTIHGECETYYTVSQNGPFDAPFPFQRQAQAGQDQSDEQNRQGSQSQESSGEEKQKLGYNYQKDQAYNKNYNYENNNNQQQNYFSEDRAQQGQEYRGRTRQGRNSHEHKSQEQLNSSSEEQQEQRQRYFGARDSQESSNEYKTYNSYNQFNAYKQYAQQADSASAEDSHETRQGELPWPQTFDQFCEQNDQVYEIVKAINFTTCKNKPVLAYSTAGELHGRPGDNTVGSAFERAVITRFLACGKDRKQYTILKIRQEEQVNFGLRLNQKTMAGTVQNLTLIRIAKASTPAQVENPRTIEDLSYTFDPQEQKLQKKGMIPHAYNDVLGENARSSEEEGQREENITVEPQHQSSESQTQESQEQQKQQYYQQNWQQGQGKYNQQQQQEAKTQQFHYQQSGSRHNTHESRNHKRNPRSVKSSEESDEENSLESLFKTTDDEAQDQLQKPSLTKAPINPLLVSPLKTSGMKTRVQALMKEIVEDIQTDKQSMAQAETLSKISIVAKILRFLNYQDIQELFNELGDKRQTQEQQTSRNIFLDAVAIAGTNPNIKFLLDLIKQKQLTGEKAAQILMSLPMYVRTPTKELLNEIFQVVDSSAVESDKKQVKTTAVLALSNLLYQACVNSRSRNARYPVALYGEFCDEKLVQRTYAPYMKKQIQKHLESDDVSSTHWAVTYLSALGNLGVPQVVPVVQNILDDETDPYVKVQAIWALKNLIVARSSQNVPVSEDQRVQDENRDDQDQKVIENEVLPILVAVSADKGEHPEVRMAAIALLVYTPNADIAIWQQLAYSTWFPASQEVHSFIYSTLKSLAALKNPTSKIQQSMQRKARAVLSLAKPIRQGLAKSRNVFSSYFAEHLQTGGTHQVQYFGSKDSNVPNYMFYRNHVHFGNGAQGESPIELSIQGNTVQKLASFVLAQLRKQSSVSEAHPELQQLHQLLGIQTREQDDEIEGSIKIKIRSEMERLFSINEQVIQDLLQKAQAQALPKLLNGLPINYQKTLHLIEQTLEMPSAMGIPVTYNFRMPVHLSLRGMLKIVNENGLKDVQLQAELHPVYAWKTHGKISFKAPFTGKKYQAGVQRHMVVEAPFRALVRKAPRGQVVVAITPSQLTNGSPTGKIDLITFHQRPYTAIITDEFWPTSHKEGGQMKIVHAVDTPYKNERTFGQKSLGLNVILKEETEYKTQHEGPSGWVNFWKRFHTPACYFNVGWLGAAQVRPVQRVVSLDVSKSETKTLAIIVGAKIHQNTVYSQLWQDSSSGSSQSSEESASSESKQDSSSQQQDSHQQDSQERKNRHNFRSQARSQENVADSNEDTAQRSRVVAVALIGKRTPIRSIITKETRGQIQKILQKENPTTVHYFVQVSKSNGRVYVRAAAGEAAKEAALSLPQTSESLKAVREAVAQQQHSKIQQDGCLEFEGEYDAPKHANRHQLLVLRKALLQEELSVKVKAEVQFGQSCKDMKHEIKMQGKLQRGPKMTEWAQKKSPQAKKCEQDEQQGFYVSPVCIYVAEHQAAALNQADLKVTFSQDLPVEFRNRTNQVEDFVKAYLYPYMSHDRNHEGTGEKEIRIQAHHTPNKEYVDVTITKPNSQLSFRSVKTNRVAKAVLPLTATQSISKNIRERTLRREAEAFCAVQGNQINTFDNVTYRFNKEVSNDCYHVLVKDCSDRQPVAVLVNDVTQEQKEITILLGSQTKIELIQPSKSGSNSRLLGQAKLHVRINDQHVESLPRVIRAKDTGRFIAKIEKLNDQSIQVISPEFQVASNGKYVVVYGSNSLRNRTCGLCGDFDGEKVGEMRGPKDCPLSSGSLLVASYAFQSLNPKDKQCKVQSQAKKQIAHEEANCLSNAANYPNQPRMYSSKNAQRNNVSNFCLLKIKPVIRQLSFEIVKNTLKPFFMPKPKIEKISNRIADLVVDQLEEILSHNSSASDIAKAVLEVICDELKAIGVFPGFVCRAAGPLLRKYILLSLNPICATSRCCVQSNKSFNPAEIQQDVAYFFADASDANPSEFPFIAAAELPMSCLDKFERILSKILAKDAFAILSDDDVSSTERRRIADEVTRVVREDVRLAMGPGGNGKLLEKIEQHAAPLLSEAEDQRSFMEMAKQAVANTLQKLQKKNCFFPQPNRKN